MFQLGGLLRCLPGMKKIHRRLQLATFSELLAILIEQHVPLPDALILAADASGDSKLVHSANVLVGNLRNGITNANVVKSEQGLPPFIFWLLTSNQNSSTLVPALRQTGQMYRREAVRQTDRMRVWFPLAAVIIIGGGSVLFYVLVLFWPLIQLLGDISR